jgi:hypothetical protein
LADAAAADADPDGFTCQQIPIQAGSGDHRLKVTGQLFLPDCRPVQLLPDGIQPGHFCRLPGCGCGCEVSSQA